MFSEIEVDDGDGFGLVLAPGAGDALFELGGIPRQVAIDHHAGGLQIQAGRAGVGAEKDAAPRVVLEGVDLGAAALLGHAAGVPGVTDVALVAQVAHQLEHPFPLGEDDDLGVILAAFVQEFLDFRQLGTGAVVGVEDVIGVADHPHHGQFALELVLLLLRERAALGDVDQAA